MSSFLEGKYFFQSGFLIVGTARANITLFIIDFWKDAKLLLEEADEQLKIVDKLHMKIDIQTTKQ